MDETKFNPNWWLPVSEHVFELLEALGIPKEDFQKRMGFSDDDMSRFTSGEKELRYPLALKVAEITGREVGFWVNLEILSRQTRARLAEEKLEKIRWPKEPDAEAFSAWFKAAGFDQVPDDRLIIDPMDPKKVATLLREVANLAFDAGMERVNVYQAIKTLGLMRLLGEAVMYEAEAFEEDTPVDGSALVDFFSEWRQRAATAV